MTENKELTHAAEHLIYPRAASIELIKTQAMIQETLSHSVIKKTVKIQKQAEDCPNWLLLWVFYVLYSQTTEEHHVFWWHARLQANVTINQ